MKVLILGGYGNFGGRLVERLAGEERLELLVAGRSLARAEAFCRQLQSRARLVPAAMDRDGDLDTALATLAPAVLVDASGPFQAYGEAPYRVVEACLRLGIHYLDLADGVDFVRGVAAFDQRARERGVFLLTGVSTFPVLTAAVVRHLAGHDLTVERVTAGIAPSPYARVGWNVLRAITGYAGRPVAMLKDGVALAGHGWCDTRRFTIAVPGRIPLRPLRFSLVEVPDLQVLSDLWPSLQSVWTGAGPVPAVLHRAFNGLAALVRRGLLPSVEPLAGLMHWAMRVLPWGEHRGGMFVVVEGRTGDGTPVRREWHLLAEGDDGPYIPIMPAESLVRRLLAGRPVPPGARIATRDLELADYQERFAGRAIWMGVRVSVSAGMPLYRELLGSAWMELPPAVRALHEGAGRWQARGRATVERGAGFLANLAARLFGFPKAGTDIPVTVSFAAGDGRETWTRSFAGSRFQSIQQAGAGPDEGLLREDFGPFRFGLALVVGEGRLSLVLRRWSLLGLPLPLALAPRGEAAESAEGGRFHFHVEIAHPWTGPIVTYRGWLVPDAASGREAAPP